MKKVMLINHGLGSGGIEAFTVNLAKNLPKDKYEVSIALALDEGNKQFYEDDVCKENIVMYRTSDLGSTKRLFLHAKKLYLLLRKHPTDIVHSNMGFLSGLNLFVAWCAGVPVRVCHSHTSQSEFEQQTGKRMISKAYHFVMKTVCKLFSNRRCGCSEGAMEYLFGKKWRKLKNTAIINNGIDTKRFSSHTRETSFQKKRIVTVGRLSNVKNPFFAVEIIEQLSKLRQDFEYLWVGNGELMDAVRARIEERGLQEYIQLLGVRSDVETVLADCDVFLLPSLFEGLPVSLVEAQAAGLPCLITDTITREVNCGGCLYESLNSPASRWAQILSDLLDGKIAVSIEAEKLEKFDAGYMIRQLEEVYGG